MLPWEMLLLLGYHQLTPCSIFRRRLGSERGGGGDECIDGEHEEKRKEEFSEMTCGFHQSVN